MEILFNLLLPEVRRKNTHSNSEDNRKRMKLKKLTEKKSLTARIITGETAQQEMPAKASTRALFLAGAVRNFSLNREEFFPLR